MRPNALPARFEQADPRGNRYVEAFDTADHGYARQFVAGFAGQPAHAVAFGAQHPGDRTALVDGIYILFGLASRPHHPDTQIPQLAQAAGKIGDHDVRYRLRRAAGHLDGCRTEAAGAILRRHHGLSTRRVRHAQAGAEIVRIGDAIQHEQQGGTREGLHDIVERQVALGRRDAGNYPLMPHTARQAFQPRGIGGDDAHTRRACQSQQIPHPLVLAVSSDVDVLERFRRTTQSGRYGVEAVDQAGFAHTRQGRC